MITALVHAATTLAPPVASPETLVYRVLFLLHILAVLVAFAPMFVVPLVSLSLRRGGRSLTGSESIKAMVSNLTRVHGPAMVLAGLFGIGLIGASSEDGKMVWDFSQTWVSAAMVLWLALVAVVFGLIRPNDAAVGRGDSAAEQKLGMFYGIAHLLLLLMLVDMIWKPGVA